MIGIILCLHKFNIDIIFIVYQLQHTNSSIVMNKFFLKKIKYIVLKNYYFQFV